MARFKDFGSGTAAANTDPIVINGHLDFRGWAFRAQLALNGQGAQSSEPWLRGTRKHAPLVRVQSIPIQQ